MSRIGINGFDQFGQLLLRAALYRKIKISSINAPGLTPEYVAYLLKFKSIHGRFHDAIAMKDKKLILNGEPITVISEPDPEKVKWAEHNVAAVIESSGLVKTKEGADKMLKNGAKTVLLRKKTKDVPHIVCGVNLDSMKPDMKIISNFSATVNATGPLAKLINDKFKIEDVFLTTIRAKRVITSDFDPKNPNTWREARNRSTNVLPLQSRTATRIGEIIPDLKDKFSGMTYRVPVENVSIIDMIIKIKEPTNIDCLLYTLEQAKDSKELKGILDYTNYHVVNSDLFGNPNSLIVDLNLSKLIKEDRIKLVAWYDNHWALVNRWLDLASHAINLQGEKKDANQDKNSKDCKKK